MAPWAGPIQPGGAAPRISSRAAGVRGEVLRATELVPSEHRAAVFRRRVPTFELQRWLLGVAVEMCRVLATLLDRANFTAEEWLQVPFVGDWPFDVSRKCSKLRSKKCELRVPGKTWRDMPGCLKRRAYVVSAIRGTAQLARRLDVAGNSDGTRNPRDKRWCVRTTTRRLVRGSPPVGQSVDFWPGMKAARRPEVAFPGGEPREEPVEPPKKFGALKTDLSRAKKAQSSESTVPPRPAVRAGPFRGQGCQGAPVPAVCTPFRRSRVETSVGRKRLVRQWGCFD